ncbi:MAG: cytochrome ubiquinol oxidase subunit I [Nitrososphaerota archaeon]|jgi:cytochrome d ubiquinol oxidase subunit I|nr:cytochrome ubiquinol oxidase subunit I [Nitrososphaerota archaeon]MDG6927761.1 cytochrome ubiquinol oxidase subunit I [Nitrososphaerota archaeon]MDG6930300.1 cytochrome ubiquinol oxidase subunit I [Nitrososphaerota archaeon]MDG6932723.1 cytochrome ubiquinol oxidase subunit I [Nitrososphaerota archaeon]MDG6935346.1 cytochrome ubiquinol oxidase subunit I [Nitrososphaerota archaeon]
MISPILLDRATMGFSLAVHIFLVSFGISLPVVIGASEFIGIRYGDKYYKALARRLTTALLIFFAIGTASGTVVALELLLLWPKFMALVGSVDILPLYIEVFAFFTEAIFLATYAYSWDKIRNQYYHFLLIIPIMLGSIGSGILITLLNSFMNTPAGFNISEYLSSGTITGVNPIAALFPPSAIYEDSHGVGGTILAGLVMVMAYFVYKQYKSSGEACNYYKKATKLLLGISSVIAAFVIYTGVYSIEMLYYVQPEKYAAFEGDIVPTTHAAEMLFGLFINGKWTDYISIPNLQSFLATGSASGLVPGLSQFPTYTWPPLFVHDMFDFMVLLGFLLGIILLITDLVLIIGKYSNRFGKVAIIGRISKWDVWHSKWTVVFAALSGALALVLMEVGWVMEELGRQPWIIYGVMLVSQAGNVSTSILPIMIAIIVFYAAILPFTLIYINRHFRAKPVEAELQ